MTIDLILVPQGAEYSAVIRGLRACVVSETNPPPVLSIPIGISTLAHLKHFSLPRKCGRISSWQDKNVLLMGLGGSLSPQYRPGDIVLLESLEFCSPSVFDSGNLNGSNDNLAPSIKNSCLWERHGNCKYIIKPSFMPVLHQILLKKASEMSCHPRISTVHGVTADRIITTAQEKQHLGRAHHADVVDMEGIYILNFLEEKGARVGIVRVISDGVETDIPDLNAAIDGSGNLNLRSMLWQFLQRPVAATHLLQGSLKGLKNLEMIATCFASLTV